MPFDNRPIVIGPVGVTAMQANEEFERTIYKELGLRPVFKMKHDYWDATTKYTKEIINGHEVTHIEHVPAPEGMELPSSQEVDEFIAARSKYVAEQLLYKHGWDAFYNYCMADYREKEGVRELLKHHTPCEGPDKQCQMDCYLIGECHP